MLRRTADSAYWLGRYVERAEATARLVDVQVRTGLEAGSLPGWDRTLDILSMTDDFSARHDTMDETTVLNYLAFDSDNPSSVMSCLARARENARAIRGQVSSEMWECVNRWYLELREWDVATMERRSPFDFFARVKDGSHLFHGVANRTQMIGEARDFYNVGQFVERADNTARLLDIRFRDLKPADNHSWVAVLKSVGAYEAFLKTYRQGLSPERVAEFLVFNPEFPASILFSLGRVQNSLRRISGNWANVPKNEAERAAGKLHNDLVFLTVEEISDRGMHDFLEDVQVRCADVGTAVWETYLSY